MDVLRAERICRSQTPAGIPHRQRRPASTQPAPWTDAVPARGPETRGSGETTRNLRVGRRTPAIDQISCLEDRKSAVKGQSVAVRVDIGGRRIIKKKKEKTH